MSPQNPDETPDSGPSLADRATAMKGNPSTDEELAQALAQLSPEEAAAFVTALELIMKRRRLLLRGYLASLIALIGGMIFALYMYGTREKGTFVGWVFLVPFAAVGIILMVFGRLAKAPPKAPGKSPPPPADPPSTKGA